MTADGPGLSRSAVERLASLHLRVRQEIRLRTKSAWLAAGLGFALMVLTAPLGSGALAGVAAVAVAAILGMIIPIPRLRRNVQDITYVADNMVKGTVWRTPEGEIGFVTEAGAGGATMRVALPSAEVRTYRLSDLVLLRGLNA